MNNREFSESMERQYARCKELLCTKQAEYTPDKDVFEVFKKASTLCGEGGVKSAIFDFMLKHIVSISDMCHTNKEFSLDRWNEKLTDAMNYLFLLKAYVEEDERNHEGERCFECSEIGCDNCKFNTTCTFNSMYNKHGKCAQGFEWIPDKLSYVSWDELAKAVKGDTNSSCCMDCNECDYCVCDCTEDALLSCNNNCYGCPHMGCTKDMETLDLTHLVQEPNEEPTSVYNASSEDYEDFWHSSSPKYDDTINGLSQEIAIAREFENEFQ